MISANCNGHNVNCKHGWILGCATSCHLWLFKSPFMRLTSGWMKSILTWPMVNNVEQLTAPRMGPWDRHWLFTQWYTRIPSRKLGILHFAKSWIPSIYRIPKILNYWTAYNRYIYIYMFPFLVTVATTGQHKRSTTKMFQIELISDQKSQHTAMFKSENTFFHYPCRSSMVPST